MVTVRTVVLMVILIHVREHTVEERPCRMINTLTLGRRTLVVHGDAAKRCKSANNAEVRRAGALEEVYAPAVRKRYLRVLSPAERPELLVEAILASQWFQPHA